MREPERENHNLPFPLAEPYLDAILISQLRRWSTVFGVASFFTPFFQGLTLGALTTGDIRLAGDRVATGFFAGWLTPFALACGLFALALFAFLAATYMTVDTKSEPDLQNDFRRRAIWSQVTLISCLLLSCLLPQGMAPRRCIVA